MAGKKKNLKHASKKVVANSISDKPVWMYLLPVLLLTFFVFSPTLKNYFVINWDDDGYIINNPLLKNFSWESIVYMFSHFHLDNYHPLTTLSNAIEYDLYKLEPKPYHFNNLLLHLVNTSLVFYFIKQLIKSKEAAILVALLFAIHPMHVESVAWISERKDLLYTTFFLSAMIVYNRFLKEGKSSLYLWSIVLMLLACLSKSAAIALTPVLFLLDYYAGKKVNVKSIIQKLPFLVLSILFGVIALLSQSSSGSMDMVEDSSILDKLLFAFYGLSFYIAKMFVPANLSSMYLYPLKENGWLPIAFYLAPLLIMGIGFFAYRLKSLRKEVVFGLLFYLFTIGMVIQIVPVGKAIVAERYAYVPYIGLFFIVAKLYLMIKNNELATAQKIKPIMNGVLLLFIVSFSVSSWNRSKDWKDSHSLFTSIIEQDPDNYYGYFARGVGRSLQNNVNGSIADYTEAIKRDSSHATIFYNRAIEFEKLGRKAEAVSDYTAAIRLNAEHFKAYYNRGNLKYMAGNLDGAIHDYTQTVKYENTHSQAYCNRAIVQLKLGDTIRALNGFTESIKHNPNLVNALVNRGALYLAQSKLDLACQDYNTAMLAGSKDAKKFYEYYCKPKQ